ncbi:MAG: hypothetical protein AVDCRST_MAG44-1340, partial [uncultured Sphingomonas sp.]
DDRRCRGARRRRAFTIARQGFGCTEPQDHWSAAGGTGADAASSRSAGDPVSLGAGFREPTAHDQPSRAPAHRGRATNLSDRWPSDRRNTAPRVCCCRRFEAVRGSQQTGL